MKESLLWGVMVVAAVLMGSLLITTAKSIAYSMSYKISYFIDTVLAFPGVVLHECSHALGAIVTGAKVMGFSLLRKGGELGNVQVGMSKKKVLGSIQRCVIASAPILIGLLVLKWLSVADINKYLKAYLMFCCAWHMNMSGQDLKVMIPGIPIVVVLLTVGNYIWRLAL